MSKAKKQSDKVIALVNVKKRDILNGSPLDPEFCPIACATKRLVRGRFVDDVRVGSQTIHIDVYEVEMPKRARLFVSAFDNGKKNFSPFQFRIRLPKSVLKPSAIRKAELAESL